MKLLPIAFAIVLAGACGKDKAEPPPPPPTEGIELVSPGTGPRHELRYRVAKGSKHVTSLELEVDVEAAGQGGPLPTLVITTELTVEDVSADGSMQVRRTILDVSARDRPGGAIQAAQMTEQMQLIRGLSLIGTVTARGRVLDMKVDTQDKQLPPAIDAQIGSLVKSFEQTTMPLPGEPVGTGASWRFRKTVDQQGMKLRTTTTTVITAISDEAATFTMTTQAEGPDQSVTQAGTTIAIKNIRGTGTGGGTLHLSRLTMTGELAFSFASDMTADDGTARMSMTMVTRVAPAELDAGAAAGSGDAGAGSGDAAAGSGDAGAGSGDAAAGSGDAAGSTHGAHSAP